MAAVQESATSRDHGRPQYCNVGFSFRPNGTAWNVMGYQLYPSPADPCNKEPVRRVDVGDGKAQVHFEFETANAKCGILVSFVRVSL